MRTDIIALTIATALAAPAALAAQASVAEWEGTWLLEASESDFGMSPAPDSAAVVITRADDHLVMTRKVWTSMMGHRTVEFDQATDGEAGAGSSSRGEEIPSRVWWEGDDLVMEVEVESNMGEIVVTDRLSLVGDDQLVIDRLMDVPNMGEMTQTLVHTKR